MVFSSNFIIRDCPPFLHKWLLILGTFIVLFTATANLSFAQTSDQFTQINNQTGESNSTLEGKVTTIVAHGKESFLDEMVPFQELNIEITRGETTGQKIVVKNSAAAVGMGASSYQEYQVGDKVKVAVTQIHDGQQQFTEYYIQGKVKRDGLTVLLVLFVIVVLLVGRLWGALSLVGLAVSFLVIFRVIVPMIIRGTNPVLAAVLGSIIIVPTTFYISHGFNRKTHVGVVATFIGLVVTGLLAVYFVDATHLTGFASEEAGFLQVERQGSIDIKGLLLAGIIIGTLGILDDVTVGQASLVQQLKKANPQMNASDLFQKGMAVGQDHISSMVNTLVLVYSGSALPLLLLFFDSQKTFLDILEFELIAEEIVRMLVGSMGLVMAAPLATIMAAIVFTQDNSLSVNNGSVSLSNSDNESKEKSTNKIKKIKLKSSTKRKNN